MLPAGIVGIAYRRQITASPAGDYTYSIISGQLPPGLSLDPDTGVVSGMPTSSGNYGFTVLATDPDGCFGMAVYDVSILDQATMCRQNFDTAYSPLLPYGWTSTGIGGHPVWTTSSVNPDTPPYDAYAPSAMTAGMTELLTPSYVVSPTGTQMTFRAAYNFEDGGPGSLVGMDGMVLEISINGAPFVDIMDAGGEFVTGGYDKVISNDHGSPIAGRMAWSGLSGGTASLPAYITTTVNMPAAAFGQAVQMRWVVASDNNWMASGDAGARIDTILGTACPPTAARAEITGRVLTRDGRWIPNAAVTLRDSMGAVRITRTGSFGYYRFDDLPVGGTYVLNAADRNHTFDPRTIVLLDSVIDFDIVSRE